MTVVNAEPGNARFTAFVWMYALRRRRFATLGVLYVSTTAGICVLILKETLRRQEMLGGAPAASCLFLPAADHLRKS